MYPQKFIFNNYENRNIERLHDLESETFIVQGIAKDSDSDLPMNNVLVQISKSDFVGEKPLGFSFTDEDGKFEYGPVTSLDHVILKAWIKKIKYL